MYSLIKQRDPYHITTGAGGCGNMYSLGEPYALSLDMIMYENYDPGNQLIPPVPSLFTRFRPYLAHFFPVVPRLLRVFTVSPRRFQRAPSRNQGQETAGKGPMVVRRHR